VTDYDPESLDSALGRCNIVGRGEARHDAIALAYAGDHERPVADRLIAGDSELPRDALGRPDDLSTHRFMNIA
jgi:hypothetical protein